MSSAEKLVILNTQARKTNNRKIIGLTKGFNFKSIKRSYAEKNHYQQTE